MRTRTSGGVGRAVSDGRPYPIQVSRYRGGLVSACNCSEGPLLRFFIESEDRNHVTTVEWLFCAVR